MPKKENIEDKLNEPLVEYTTEIPESRTLNKEKKAGSTFKNKSVILLSLTAIIFLVSISYVLLRNSLMHLGFPRVIDHITPEMPASNGLFHFGLVRPIFAQIKQEVSDIAPSIPYSKPTIATIENIDGFLSEGNIAFDEEQKKALEESGFFLVNNYVVKDQKGGMDDFYDSYNAFDGNSDIYYRKPSDAVFITSDYALHLYHILVDRSFQRMEETTFQPMLTAITRALFLNSIEQYNNAASGTLKESYKRLSAFYLVPLVVLDAGRASSGVDLNPEDFENFAQYLDAMDAQTIAASESKLTFSLSDTSYAGVALSDDIYEWAKNELQLIQNAKGIAASPLFTPLRKEFKNDYSQFVPRSHYTKNDILKSYFIAMMWFGRMGFALNNEDLTRDALIITGQINTLNVGDERLADMWSNMAAVIDFFVGEVDDLTAYDYTKVIKEVYGDKVSDAQFSDIAQLEMFIAAAKKELPNPKIVSEALDVFDDSGKRDELLAETKQFRFMGQRFTPDAYIINNLTQGVGAPDPETGQLLPTMPTALMPLRVIAPENTTVKGYLDAWVNDPQRILHQARQSDKIIPKVVRRLIGEFSSYAPSVWTQNIYWSWMNMFRTLLAGYGQGYPAFMQGDNWVKKSLGTVLGSYTELKHDTLLYAKQSYAELGGGGNTPEEIPPVVKGYAEPDLLFWNQIITLAQTTQQGLKDRNVFPEEFEYKYKSFIESAIFFRDIAKQELQNKKISDTDFEKLRTINQTLSRVVEPIGGQELTEKDKRAGIIADIHTDAVRERILYEATGKPLVMYVAVQDANGARLTRGAVFNHYEFDEKLDGRLSDEDWQKKVYDHEGVLPQGDSWTHELVK